MIEIHKEEVLFDTIETKWPIRQNDSSQSFEKSNENQILKFGFNLIVSIFVKPD